MIPLTASVLLDTNVLVHLIRGSAIGQRIAADHQLLERPERPFISIVTVGELKSLAMKFGWGSSKQRNLDDLISELVVMNLNQGAIIQQYAEIDHFCEKVLKPARPMAKNDIWIAATAAAVDAHLLTTDPDFDHLDPRFIKVARINPTNGEML